MKSTPTLAQGLFTAFGLLVLFSAILNCSSLKRKPDRKLATIVKSRNFTAKNLLRPTPHDNIYIQAGALSYQGAELNSAQLCLREICGSERNSFHLQNAEKLAKQKHIYKPSHPLYREIENLLDSALESRIDNLQFETSIIEWGSRQTSLHATETTILFQNALFLSSAFFETVSDFLASSPKNTKSIKLDLKEFDHLSAEDKQYLLDAEKAGYVDALKTDARHRQDITDLGSFLNSHYPNKSHSSALKEAVKECAQTHRELTDGLKISLENLLEIMGWHGHSYCIEVASKSMAGPIDQDRILKELVYTKTMSLLILNQRFKSLLSRPLKTRSILEQNLNVMESDVYRVKKDLYTKKINYQKQKRQMMDACHKAVGPFYEATVSSLRQKTARQALLTLKNTTKDLIRFQNPKDQDAFNKAIDQVSFFYPPTQDEFVRQLKQRIKRPSRSALSSLDRLSDEAKASYLVINTASSEAMEFDDDDVPQDLFTPIREICDSYKINTLNDHIYTANGDVYLSWSSIYDLKYGIGVMAHELGHFVSKWLKSQNPRNFDFSLWDERACVTSFHQTQFPSSLLWLDNYMMEPPYAEEDWADRFAARLISLIPDLPQTNFTCSFQRSVNGTYMIELDNKELKNHSAGFFRALHVEQVLKGELPRSCLPFKSRVSCEGWHFR